MNLKKNPTESPEKEQDKTLLLDYFPFRDSKFIKIAVPVIILWFLMLCALSIYLCICDHNIWLLGFALLYIIFFTIILLSCNYRVCIYTDKIECFTMLRKTTVAKLNRVAIEIKYGYRAFICNFLDLEHNEKIILTCRFSRDISPIKEKRILLEINGYAIYDCENILKRY